MGGTTVDFSYFFGGLRKTKTSGGVTKNYYYDGDRLIAEKWSTGAYLLYHYDETGSPYAITYSANGSSYAKYYLIKNLQGDVLQIRNVNNTVVANYEYDAWGKVVSIKYANGNDINVSNHIGVINPIRYRGYYYDSETGFYYLKSRYYDPAIGRFISADSLILVGGSSSSLNLFAYCGNNPVNRVDYGGNFFAELWDFAQAAASEIGKAIGVMSPAYAGCGGVAVADGPLPFGDIAAISGAALITVGAIGYGIYQAATAPAPIAIPEIKLEVKEKDGVLPGKPRKGLTYYHVTTPENVAAIMSTGVMKGSIWEGGHVFAWTKKPNSYAIKNSGAHFGTIISFKTNAHFIPDKGITDPAVSKYGPVISFRSGPITVWDIRIVGE